MKMKQRKKKTISYREFDDGKNVLRKAMSDFIPDEIINQKKTRILSTR